MCSARSFATRERSALSPGRLPRQHTIPQLLAEGDGDGSRQHHGCTRERGEDEEEKELRAKEDTAIFGPK